MSFINKLKTDATSSWNAIEGKLSGIKSPILRLAIVAGVVLVALSLLSRLLPLVLGIAITAVLVVFLFKLFHDEGDDSKPS